MPTPSLTKRISPKHQKQAFGLLSVVMVYSLLGFFAAPLVAKKMLTDYVAEELKLKLVLTDIEINPLQLAARVDGLHINSQDGSTLVAAKSVYVNVGVLSSLWQRRIEVDEVDLQQPVVNAHINQQGQLNLSQLIPPSDDKDSTTIPWQLSVLAIHGANLAFVDDSRSQPFATQLKALNIDLYQLSSQAADKGRYQFSAQTAKGERLSWQGTVALQPIRSQGTVRIERLQASTPAAYLGKQLPVTIQEGLIDLAADYQFSLINNQADVSLAKGHLRVVDIKAETNTNHPLRYQAKELMLDGFSFQSPRLDAKFSDFLVNQLQLVEPKNTSPLLELQQLALKNGAWQAQQDQASIQQLDIKQLLVYDQQRPLISLPEVSVEKFSVKPAQQSLNTGRIVVTGGETSLQLLANNQLNWQQAVTNIVTRLSSPTPAANTANTPWTYALGELQLAEFKVLAEDKRQQPTLKETVFIRRLTVNPELNLNRPHVMAADISLSTGGKMTLQGQLQETPLTIDARLKLTELALPPFASYLNDMVRLRLESGTMDIDGHLYLRQQRNLEMTFDGNLGVNNFAANDLALNQRFLAWKRLVGQGVKWQLEPMQMTIRQVIAEQPFTRLVIAPDNTLNLEQVMATSNNSQAVKTSIPNSKQIPVRIDKVSVINGSMLFADLTIKPQFATGIQALNGDIRDVSMADNSYAKIALAGRVDQYGTAMINGAFNPFNPDKKTNVLVKFQNIELTTLTPYSAKFAGYRIDKGKLSLDLAYKIENRQLVSTNKIVLNQLTLGDKVDSPDAVSLPLRLAIALLKDSNGVIDLDIPLTGSLDDPKFRVGPIIWQAFVNVITKVATAPFRFIASLVGGGDDMDSIAFSAGQTELSADDTAKLTRLAEALAKRPSLSLELRGAFDQEADGQALKVAKLKQQMALKLSKNSSELTILESLLSEKLGREALLQQRTLALPLTTDTTQTKEALLAAQARYKQSLYQRLVELQTLAEGELRQLALERAKAMRIYLVEKNSIEDRRIFILEPEPNKVNEQQLIVSKVSVNVNGG